MRKLTLLTAVALLAACSDSSPRMAPVGSTDDVSGGDDTAEGARGPKGDDVGLTGDRTVARDGGSSESSAAPDFVQCADTRADAERGPKGTNVVWVVDNSGSMDEEARFVQDNLNRFAESIVGADVLDYRVVLITERDFVRVPDPLGSDTKHFLHIEEDVGSEEPLADLLGRFDDYADFLLKGVVTHFVVVTDDESEIRAQSFVSSMKANLSSEFRVHTIASPPGEMPAPMPSSIFDDDDDDDDEGCTGRFGAAAEPGVENWEAAKLTGGLTFSICSEDWSALFSELAKQVGESAAVPCTIQLPAPPAGQQLHHDLINVLFTSSGAPQGQVLPRVDSAAGCGTKSGWHYDDPLKPSGILLCPSSCTAAAQGGSLEIALGCETVFQ